MSNFETLSPTERTSLLNPSRYDLIRNPWDKMKNIGNAVKDNIVSIANSALENKGKIALILAVTTFAGVAIAPLVWEETGHGPSPNGVGDSHLTTDLSQLSESSDLHISESSPSLAQALLFFSSGISMAALSLGSSYLASESSNYEQLACGVYRSQALALGSVASFMGGIVSWPHENYKAEEASLALSKDVGKLQEGATPVLEKITDCLGNLMKDKQSRVDLKHAYHCLQRDQDVIALLDHLLQQDGGLELIMDGLERYQKDENHGSS